MPEVETLHSWDLSTAEARDLQLELAARVDRTRALPPIETVAGADVSYELRGKWLYAADHESHEHHRAPDDPGARPRRALTSGSNPTGS